MMLEELMLLADRKTKLVKIENGVVRFENEVGIVSFSVEEPIICVKSMEDDLYGFPVFCVMRIWDYDSLEAIQKDFSNAPWITQYLEMHPELLTEFAKQQEEAEKNMEEGYIY